MIARTCRILPFRMLAVALCIAATGLAFRLAPATILRGADGALDSASLPVPGPRLVPPQVPGRFVGAGSCAAAACHGGAIQRDPQGSEYSVWIQSDRHAIAYTTLFSRRSQEIVRNLGLKAAHTETLCLKCHSLAADVDETAAGRLSVLADGVSCEACHGAAEHWLEPHKRHDLPEAQRDFDWKKLTSEQKSQWGFTDTKSILARTTACLKCHVGSAGRDVNHDLIAAGHPRLYFEMSAYLAKLPAHWDRAKDRQRHPALEAKLWTVGQLATADAALGLLDHRSSLKPSAPWPEFAEYACFACHHDLAAPSWRQSLDSQKPLGRYRWGTWNFALVERLVRTRDGAAAADEIHSGLHGLEEIMAHPFPPQAAVAEQARKLRGTFHGLAQSAEQGHFNADELQRLLKFLAHEAAPDAMSDWETSTQLYLALVAIAQSGRDTVTQAGSPAPDQEIFDKLQEIRNLLRFPAYDGKFRFSSPRDFDPTRSDDYLPAKMQQLREMINAK